MIYVAIIVVVVLTLTSRTFGEVPVLLLTFVTAMILNQGSNFLLGKISFVSNSVTSILQLALSLDYAVILCNRFKEEHQALSIHDAKTELQKSELFDKVRKGEIRVLLGSTAKMGTGTNVQDKLIAVHDLDIPWRPADLDQRAGRIIRQGNQNKNVEIYRYVTKGTFDAYSYQTLENKQKFISQIMTSKEPARKCEDVDQQALTYSEI